jgi:probable rRNA maturation factor
MVDAPTMRALNRRFLRHHGLTDVLSFRYDEEPVVGEILVSPAFARRYADDHGVPYRQELARYVIHGLLHWAGHDDQTPSQRKRMRALEDALLGACASGTAVS